nr:MBL fold metallo-hydrolase [Methanospirillum stamsii]
MFFGPHHTFLCDTHLGPESMKEVIPYLNQDPAFCDLVIFNSHSDWDHIWGNCAFLDSIIIGHVTCRERMQERGAFDLNRQSSLTRGHVTLIPPGLTFKEEICFEDDDIEFIYAPGHTIDSSICYDRKERILYVGDLVEGPIPYLDYDRLDIYLETLEMLLIFPADIMISAHSGIVTKDLIIRNMEYIREVIKGNKIDTRTFGQYEAVHRINLNTLLMLRYEKLAKKMLKNAYDFSSFWSVPSNLDNISLDELEELMKNYLKNPGSKHLGI